MAKNTGTIKRGFNYDQANSRLEIYCDGVKVASFDSDTSNIAWLPATDDTGSFSIGNGTKDMDFKVFLGTTASYILADVGNKYLSLIQTYLYAPNFPSSSPTAGVVYRSATTGALYT